MEFNKRIANGEAWVYATGEIVKGDAVRLAEVLRGLPRDKYGLKEIAFDSTGGSVLEALVMGRIMEHEKTYTVVHSRDACASACAAILFLEGSKRRVYPGSYLIFHSCSSHKSGGDSSSCNDILAKNAQRLGIPYVVISTLMGRHDPIALGYPDVVRWGLVTSSHWYQ
jgi:hypothetical protein